MRADAAVTINGLVRWTINHGRAGLEAWAGTPGTVGGAIFGNAHFGGRLIGDLVTEVRLVAPRRRARRRAGSGDGVRIRSQPPAGSRARCCCRRSFACRPGEPAALRAIARESLAFRKRTQPLDTPSAGCVFQNPERGRDAVPDGIPWSAGALVDRAGLKGAARRRRARLADARQLHRERRRGDARRTSSALIERCKAAVRDRFGVELREEIVYLGEF